MSLILPKGNLQPGSRTQAIQPPKGSKAITYPPPSSKPSTSPLQLSPHCTTVQKCLKFSHYKANEQTNLTNSPDVMSLSLATVLIVPSLSQPNVLKKGLKLIISTAPTTITNSLLNLCNLDFVQTQHSLQNTNDFLTENSLQIYYTCQFNIDSLNFKMLISWLQ